jgi:hypothetical protein
MKTPLDGAVAPTKLKKLESEGINFRVSADNKWLIYDNSGDKHGDERNKIFKELMP